MKTRKLEAPEVKKKVQETRKTEVPLCGPTPPVRQRSCLPHQGLQDLLG